MSRENKRGKQGGERLSGGTEAPRSRRGAKRSVEPAWAKPLIEGLPKGVAQTVKRGWKGGFVFCSGAAAGLSLGLGLAPHIPVRYFRPVLAPQEHILVGFSPDREAHKLVLRFLDSASTSIFMSAYYLTDAAVAQRLIEARSRGVEVRVVLDAGSLSNLYASRGRDDSGLTPGCRTLAKLLDSGVEIRANQAYSIHHDKFVVADRLHVQTGSFNYTASAAKRNSENVLVIRDQPEVAACYLSHWARRWDEATPLTREVLSEGCYQAEMNHSRSKGD